MSKEEYKYICMKYFPHCKFKDYGTAGLCCFRSNETTSILVSLLPSGKFAVYDTFRDCTITSDIEYVNNWLKEVKNLCK